jgi:uncharacterized membrane protein YhfC
MALPARNNLPLRFWNLYMNWRIRMSTITLLMSILIILVCFGFPAILWIITARRHKGVAIAVLAGTLGFFVPQMLIRIPLLSVFATAISLLQKTPVLYALFLAGTAGLFETTGRLLVFKLLLRKRLHWRTGFATGIGHGGIEAILLVGLSYVNIIIYGVMQNAGMLEKVLSSAGASEQLAQIQSLLQALTPSVIAAAGFERTCTIVFHISISVLLLQFILKKQAIRGFVFCTLLHAALDFSAVYASFNGWGIWQVEGIAAGFAAISVVYLIKSKRFFPKEAEANVYSNESSPQIGEY